MGSRLRFPFLPLMSVCALLISASSLAQTPELHGNPEHGKAISYTCLGCHGIKGYRNAYPNYEVPKLEGQYPEYLQTALQEYKNSERSHTTMHSQASSLSEQDMADIATYFAGKPLQPQASPAGAHTPPQSAAVCVACHGTNGIGIVSMYPTLAGQWSDYLVQAIEEYKSGARKHPIMDAMAAQLKESDVRQIADYYSSLTPSLHTLERPYTRLTLEH
ncbi:MAG TPA: cytochrome c [Steroidobacteraceae bacterium]|nr:cytochrome c [Steroidobacteraceae bacterium]